jgi:uncharacterized protein
VKFWDTSAIVPLLITDAATTPLQRLASGDPEMIVWWATEAECASAIARLERDGGLTEIAANEAFAGLQRFANMWYEVEPSESVREAAVRFLRVHPLRAADALQLAAAFLAAERRPPSIEVVTLDDRLGAAARKEGFVVVAVPES